MQVANWGRQSLRQFILHYMAYTKFEVGQLIRFWLTTCSRLIPYVTLWPWPLTLRPWTFVIYRQWLGQTLYQILTNSTDLRLSCSDLKVENLGPTLTMAFVAPNLTYRKRNNSSADCLISLKFGTEFDHVIADTLKCSRSKGQRLRSQRNVWYQRWKRYKSGTDILTDFNLGMES